MRVCVCVCVNLCSKEVINHFPTKQWGWQQERGSAINGDTLAFLLILGLIIPAYLRVTNSLIHRQDLRLVRLSGKSWMFQKIPVADLSLCHYLTWLTPSCRQPYGCFHPSNKCVIAGRFPLILASRGIVVPQTDSVSADAHFLPSFSRLILGLTFLSCFPVMFFMKREWLIRHASPVNLLKQNSNRQSSQLVTCM